MKKSFQILLRKSRYREKKTTDFYTWFNSPESVTSTTSVAWIISVAFASSWVDISVVSGVFEFIFPKYKR